ncbi:MAG TPA: NUDIX domain-containing protein [Bacteroidetes bacterium]|nr:NUDIX domain-containing protein [Bacteroidota bacterium]
MYKVFYNNRPVFLTNQADTVPEVSGLRVIPFSDNKSLEKELDYFERNRKEKGLVFTYPDEEALFKRFCQSFQQINAAGGLVRDNAGRVLLIKRRGVWDLPKGKLHRDEPAETGALREVGEETGLDHLVIEKKITDTYHTYLSGGTPCLKKTTWYLMQAAGNTSPTPQTEEDITEVQWFVPPIPQEIRKATFASIADVLRKAELLAG